ncbi:unnamed protein product [Caenorhabditis auriculariae]|uniref:SAP domain-containing protein n=1 Tax=Caenorhabditis auriculariae TaxID=2777116 RepID=A0A8S1GZ99_9PELO|nr:unnamed protein product [Caenorhabditis auriculariae]
MTLTEAEAKKLTVPKLKEELSKRGLNNAGNKAELLDRLLESIQKAAEEAILDGTGVEDVPFPSDDILNEDILDASSVDGDTSKPDISLDEKEASGNSDSTADANGKSETSNVTAKKEKITINEASDKAAWASRFGLPVTSDIAKEQRAKRFGISAPSAADDAKSKRAERFGLTKEAEAPAATNEKLAERAKRFGITEEQPKSAVNEKFLQRAKRFGMIDTDDQAEKKRMRLERFK